MTQKTNTQKGQSFKLDGEIQALPASQLSQDLKNAVLIVSIVTNLFILTTWIALQVTTQYDTQLAILLFNR